MAQAIFDAGAEYGCFQLTNHGVSLDLIARMEAAQRSFFGLPLEAKAKGGCPAFGAGSMGRGARHGRQGAGAASSDKAAPALHIAG